MMEWNLRFSFWCDQRVVGHYGAGFESLRGKLIDGLVPTNCPALKRVV